MNTELQKRRSSTLVDLNSGQYSVPNNITLYLCFNLPCAHFLCLCFFFFIFILEDQNVYPQHKPQHDWSKQVLKMICALYLFMRWMLIWLWHLATSGKNWEHFIKLLTCQTCDSIFVNKLLTNLVIDKFGFDLS